MSESPERVESLAEVNRWFSGRHFMVVPSATDFSQAARSTPGGRKAASRDHHAWVDLVRLDGSLISAGYGSGLTLDDAATRARQRWQAEQEHGRAPRARRLP